MTRRSRRFLAVALVAVTVLSVAGGTAVAVAVDPVSPTVVATPGADSATAAVPSSRVGTAGAATASPARSTVATVAPTNVTGCDTPIESSGRYTLNQTIDTGGGTTKCIVVNASDVVFEGNGYTVRGQNNQTEYGIFVNEGYGNVTVRNVTVEEWEWGVRFGADGDGYNSTIRNVTATRNLNGIRVVNASTLSVRDNTIEGNGETGAPTNYGLQYRNVTGANATANAVRNNRGDGIAVVAGSDGNEFSDDRVVGNGEHGINVTVPGLASPAGNDFDNTTVRDNGADTTANGVHLAGASNNAFDDLRVNGSAGWDVLARPEAGVAAKNNTFRSADLGFENATFDFGIRDAKLQRTPVGDRPAVTFGDDVGVFLNLTNTSTAGYVDATVYYNDSELDPAVEESTLALWRYDDPWTNVGGTVDTGADTLTANVTSFSAFAPLAIDPTIDGCRAIGGEGSYRITTDINNSTADPCILVEAANVDLDGQGYTVDGVTGGADRGGIQVTDSARLTNVTVRNVTVTAWDYGVQVGPDPGASGAGIDGGEIRAVNATNNTVGVALADSNDVTLRDSDLGHNRDGVTVTVVTNATVANNALWNHTLGIGVVSGTNVVVANNTVENPTLSPSSTGIRVEEPDTTVRNNTVADAGVGINVSMATTGGATFRNDTVVNASIGVRVEGGNAVDNRFVNTTVSNSSDWSVAVVNASDTTAVATNTTFLRPNLGFENATLSFTLADARLRPEPAGSRPAPPGPQGDVGVYLNATNSSPRGFLNLTVEYDGAAVATLEEPTLSVWRNDGVWTELGRDSLNTTTNTLVKNVTGSEFSSVYAPLAEQTITDCTTVSDPGIYRVSTDITNATAPYCIRVTTSNVTIDGGNHTIDGVFRNASSAGILVNNSSTALQNVTVRNVTVTGWDRGVLYRNSSADGPVNRSAVRNVTAVRNVDGILVDGYDDTVRNATARNNTGLGIGVVGDNHTIRDNLAVNNTNFGLEFQGDRLEVLNNTARDAGGDGLFVVTSNESTFRNNTAVENGQRGLSLRGSGNDLRNTTLRNNTVGVVIEGSDNLVRNATVRDSADWSIQVVSDDSVYLSSNRSVNNSFVRPDLGIPNASLTFTARHVALRPVFGTDQPAPPPIHDDIGVYLNATNASRIYSGVTDDAGANLNVTVEYDPAAIGPDVDESTLSLWRYDGAWSDLGGTLDDGANTLEKNVTDFSVLAPLAVNRSISRCGTIDTPGRYALASDVGNDTADVCIRITASDVVLDGQGYAIDGGSTVDAGSVGIRVNNTTATLTNVTVRNVTVTEWGTGIEYGADAGTTGANDSLVVGVNASGNRASGIRLHATATNVTVRDSRAEDVAGLGPVGVNASGADHAVRNVTVEGGEVGVATGPDSSNVTVRNSTVRTTSGDGAFTINGTGHRVLDSTAENNTETGYLVPASDSRFRNNTARGNGYSGISVGGEGNAFRNTTLRANGNGTLVGGSNTTFVDATIRNSTDWSVVVATLSSPDPVTNVTFERADLGFANATPTFTARHVSVRPVPTGARPAPPTVHDDIGVYLEAANTSDVVSTAAADSAHLNLTVDYEDAALSPGLDEPTLSVWNNDGNWSDLGRDAFDPAANRLEKNVTNLSVIAPLAVNRSISECTTIDVSGGFSVVSNVTDDVADPCIEITASDVDLDGQGYALDGVNSTPGSRAVLVDPAGGSGTNVTVRNVTVRRWATGVQVGTAAGAVNDSRVEAVTAPDVTDRGIVVGASATDVRVGNSTVRNGSVGIEVRGTNHTLVNNTARYSPTAGVFVAGANHSFEATVARNNTGDGVVLSSASNVTVENATIIDNGGWAVAASNGSTGNAFVTPDLGIANATLSFEVTDVNLSPTPSANRPAPPGVQDDLGVYLNATATSTAGYLNLTVEYTDGAVSGLKESSVSLWRYNGTWGDRDGSLDEGTNTLRKNVTNFSVFAPLALSESISGCGTISEPGRYTVDSNITDDSVEVCLRITASDVVVNGQGYTIDGVDNDTGSAGIRVNNTTATVTNVTVRNVTVTEWASGIEYGAAAGTTGANDSLVVGVNASGNRASGIRLHATATNVTVRDSSLVDSNGLGQTGVNASGADHAIRNVTALGGGQGILTGPGSSNVTVRNSTVRATGFDGGFAINGTGHRVLDSTAENNTETGFVVVASDSRFRNNTARGNNFSGVSVGGEDNAFRNTTLRDNGNGAIVVGANTTFRNATLRNSTDWSVAVATLSSGDPVTNVTFERVDLGFANATPSFSARHVAVRPVPESARPAPPTVHDDIGVYLNATNSSEVFSVANDSAALNLTVEYEDAAITAGIDESTLSLWRNNGTWTDLGVDTLEPGTNTLVKNVTNFSVFAPLAVNRSISACTTIDVSGEFSVVSDITNDTADPCLRITASNVTLDGQGNAVDGVNWTNGSRAVLVDPAAGAGTNVTVTDLRVQRWATGVQVGTASGTVNDSRVEGVVAVDNTDYGIEVRSSVDDTAVRDSLVRNTSVGVRIRGTNHTLANNTVRNGAIGFRILDANHTIVDATARGSATAGVQLNGTNHTVVDATARDGANDGFQVGESNHTFENATARNNSGDGFYLVLANNVTVRNATILGNGNWSVSTALTDGNVTFVRPDLGFANATLSFAVADANLKPTATANQPTPPGVQEDIGAFLNATNTSASGYLNLTVEYDPAAIPADADESTIELWRYDGAWANQGRDRLDRTNDTLVKNVTNFSAFAPLVVDRTIDSCTTINERGEYAVVANVTDASADPCILVTASNVTLDGGNYTLDGVGGGVGREGVQVAAPGTLENVTVTDLTVARWGTGVRIGGANATGVNNSRVARITAVENDVAGIAATNASNATVVDNAVRDGTGTAIAFGGPDGVVRSNDLANNSVGIAIRPGSAGTRVLDNVVREQSRNGTGIRVDGGAVRVRNNTVANASVGIAVAPGGDAGTYQNNTVRNVSVGVRLDGASDNVFRNTTLPTNESWSVSAVPNASDGSSANNTFLAPDLGLANATVSFTVRDANLKPVPEADWPAPPAPHRDLGVYLNATNTSGSGVLELTTVYSDEVAETVDERSVSTWRNDSAGWTDLGGTNDPGTNTVRTTITGFSVFAVLGDPPTPEYAVTITDTNSPINEGRTLNVTTRLENTGNESGPLNVTLTVDGVQRDLRSPNLTVGETRTLNLSWDTGLNDGGNYTATAASPNGTDSTSVTVNTSAFFAVSNLSTNEPVVGGERLQATATVENVGDQTGTHQVRLRLDADTKDATTVTLAPGERTSVLLSWATAESDAGNYTARVISPHSSESTGATVLAPENFSVRIDDANDPVTEGDSLTVTATVENVGDLSGTQEVTLSADGTQQDSTNVTLSPGESTTVELTWETAVGDAGGPNVTVASASDSNSTPVTVQARAAFLTVEITDTNQPVNEGDTLEVLATVENTGGENATFEVELRTDNAPRDAATVSLGPGESRTVVLGWETGEGDAGNYTAQVITATTSDSTDVTVLGPRPANFSVAIEGTNQPVTGGDTLEVTATVENRGGRTATRNATLAANGSERDATPVTLASGESTTVELAWETVPDDAGNYTVTVAAGNGTGQAAVTVEAPAEGGGGGQGSTAPSVSIPEFRPTVGEPVAVEPTAGDDGSITSYEWTVDGEFASSSATLRYVFEEPGPHQVRLRVTDDDGESTTASRTVRANAPPEVEFSAPSPSLGEQVTIQADVGDPDGNVTTYVWTVDGQVVSRSDSMTYTFTRSGTHEVTLRVVDDEGAETTASRTVTVNTPPAVSIPSVGATAGEEVTVQPEVTDPDGAIAGYEWQVDGETVSESRTLTYTFEESGEHELRLRVTDNLGASRIDTRTVTVDPRQNSPPEVSLSVEGPETITVCDEVTVDASGSSDPDGAVDGYRLDLDGDGTYEAESPIGRFTHQYEEAGQYRVTVEVTDDQGATATDDRTISVADAECPQGNTTTTTTTTETTLGPAGPAGGTGITEDPETWLIGLGAALLVLFVVYYAFRRRTT